MLEARAVGSTANVRVSSNCPITPGAATNAMTLQSNASLNEASVATTSPQATRPSPTDSTTRRSPGRISSRIVVVLRTRPSWLWRSRRRPRWGSHPPSSSATRAPARNPIRPRCRPSPRLEVAPCKATRPIPPTAQPRSRSYCAQRQLPHIAVLQTGGRARSHRRRFEPIRIAQRAKRWIARRQPRMGTEQVSQARRAKVPYQLQSIPGAQAT